MISVKLHLAVDSDNFATNTYIVTNEETGETAVIDPSLSEDSLIEKIKDKNVKYILITHGHYDHIGGANLVKEKTGAKVVVHKEDQEMLLDSKKNYGDNTEPVYADILVLVNLLVNYFLLLATDKIIKFSPKTIKILLSAFLGALSSLYIFLPEVTLLSEIVFKITVCFVMSVTAFGFKSFKRCFKAMLVLFILTCAYAGVMTALWHLLKPNGMVIHNSVVYFNISPLVLVGATVGCYFVFIILVNPIPSPTQGYSLATSNGFFPVALQTLTACGRWCDSKIINLLYSEYHF